MCLSGDHTPGLFDHLRDCAGGCGRWLTQRNQTGFCDKCRLKYRCTLCHEYMYDLKLKGRVCDVCLKNGNHMADAHGDDCDLRKFDAPALAERAQRVAALADRAQRHQALFPKRRRRERQSA